MKKRLLSILLLCCMLLSLLPAAALAGDEVPAAAPEAAPAQTNGTEETGVAIDPTNFPDDNFRKFVKKYDTDGDDSLSAAEIAAVTFIEYRATSSAAYIKDMTGIEYFTALEKLICVSNHGMTKLDVSKNKALKYLDCQLNDLPALDVSQNTELTYLHCAANNLTTLDVTKNTQLQTLQCFQNQLTTLDVSKNTALESLICNDNPLASLDVTKNAALKGLWCGGNSLTSLDVTQNTALTYLDCQRNALTTLDISRNTLLETLVCNENPLTALDLSGSISLKKLYCFEDHLTSLDLSSTALTYLECYDNTYPITVGNARTFDLSTLPGSFDVSKASSWNGGTVDGTILTVDDGAERVTYTYDCGKNKSETFTLTVEKRLEEQFDLTPGGRYYFDLSAVEMPGKTLETLPDKTLHYVPFTYVGTVDAYSMESETDTAKQPYVHSLFIADYNVKNYLQRETLAQMNLIYGQTYTAGNVNYTLRAPSVGDRYRNEGEGSGLAPIDNEWDTIYQKSADYIKNWNKISSYGQDTSIWEYGTVLYVSRGGDFATQYSFCVRPTLETLYLGYRPVLELPAGLPADSLKVVTLNTDGHMPGETYNNINIIVKKGESFTAPSAEGLPLSDDTSADTPMCWVDENINIYKPGDTVPADVSVLYAFYGGFGLFLDRGDGAVEVTPDNYTDIFGDGTASFVLPKGRTYDDILESGSLTESDRLEILATGRYGENIFPNLKLKNADLTSVTLSDSYIGQGSPFFITLDGKNTIGSLNGIGWAYSTLSILGNGTLTLHVASRLSVYAQYGGNSVTVTDGLRISGMLCIDSGSLTVTGDPQAITLPDSYRIALYMDDALRLFLGSSAQDAEEAALPQLSAEMQALYERYLARDPSFTQDELDALENARAKQWADTLALFSGKTYVRIANAWDVTYLPGIDGTGDAVTDIKFYREDLALRRETFTRTGYTQTGWSKTDGGEKDYDLGAIYAEDAALTLYPVWNANQYTITFDTNGGTPVDPITLAYGTPITAPEAPSKPGYTFVGWNPELPATMPAENLTLTAQWSADPYAITYDLDGGTATGNPDSYTVESGEITLNAPEKTGYTFTGWSGTDLTGEDNLTVTIPAGSIGDRHYTAHWSLNTYSITYDLNGGTATGNPDFYTVESSTITLNPPTRTGYTFIGWSGTDLTGSDNMTVVIPAGSIGDRRYTAHWSLNTYSITYDLDGGTAFGNPDSYTVESASITLNEPTKAGYVFTGWSGTELVGENNLIVTIPTGSTGDRRYTAHWDFDPAIIAALDPTPNADFLDVSRVDWFYYDVRYVCENGLMNGTSSNRFSPYGTATRGMLVTILYRMENEPRCFGSAAFSDVKPGAYYEKAVIWASQNNIVSGYTDGTFRPDAPVTREQLASILYRYTRYRGQDVSAAETTSLTAYNDAQAVSSYALPAMRWACGTGILQGANGKLNPTGLATRAQLAAMLHRYLTK